MTKTWARTCPEHVWTQEQILKICSPFQGDAAIIRRISQLRKRLHHLGKLNTFLMKLERLCVRSILYKQEELLGLERTGPALDYASYHFGIDNIAELILTYLLRLRLGPFSKRDG